MHNVEYKIQLMNCRGSYVREIKISVLTRIKERKSKIKFPDTS